MGAGGRQNYAQAAMQTLFGEQLRQLENQAAQPAEVNQELVEQYTPQSTSVGNTVQDVLKRYTEGTGAVPSSQSAGLQGILDKIAAEKEALKDLTVTETSTRMVPQYEMTTPSSTYGLAGGSPHEVPPSQLDLVPLRPYHRPLLHHQAGHAIKASAGWRDGAAHRVQVRRPSPPPSVCTRDALSSSDCA